MKKALALAALVVACGTKDEAAGTVFFTASAGSAVEAETPAAALADGWSVHYDRFVVTFQDITMRNGDAAPVARLLGGRILDLKATGTKRIVNFDNLAASTYTRIGYRIATATADTDVGAGATDEDRQRLLAGGYAIYIEGSATNGAATKFFRWGFGLDTTYDNCRTQALVGGAVVTDATATEVGLTVDSLALYADDPGAATPTYHFGPFAAADTNGDQIIDLAELGAVPGLLERVQAAARTIGRFHDGGTCDQKAS